MGKSECGCEYEGDLDLVICDKHAKMQEEDDNERARRQWED